MITISCFLDQALEHLAGYTLPNMALHPDQKLPGGHQLKKGTDQKEYQKKQGQSDSATSTWNLTITLVSRINTPAKILDNHDITSGYNRSIAFLLRDFSCLSVYIVQIETPL